MLKNKKYPFRHILFLLKELFLASLAIVSIFMIIFEYRSQPDIQMLLKLNRIDIVIACIFLTDFVLSLLLTRNRKKYLRHNWYFIFASIPITDSIAELLRGIRLLRLIRLVRAGEHLEYSVTKR